MRRRYPITAAAVDRVVVRLERLLEAPDAAEVLGGDLATVERAHRALLRAWSSLPKGH